MSGYAPHALSMNANFLECFTGMDKIQQIYIWRTLFDVSIYRTANQYYTTRDLAKRDDMESA